MSSVYKFGFPILLAGVLIACGGGKSETTGAAADDSVATPTTARKTIDSRGGLVATTTGSISVSVPEGALGVPSLVQIAESTATANPGTLGSVQFDLLPDGVSFARPVTVIVRYAGTNIPNDLPVERLTLAYRNGNSWVPVPTVVNATNGELVAQISHFSTWAITESAEPAVAFGDVLGSANGVAVHSNVTCQGSSEDRCMTLNSDNEDGYTSGIAWQCVEFSSRYQFVRYGLRLRTASGNTLGNANAHLSNAAAAGMFSYSNGGAFAPQVGDILVSEYSGTSTDPATGHVAVVTRATPDTIFYAQQNWSNTSTDVERSVSITVTESSDGRRYTLPNFAGSTKYSIDGWLRSPVRILEKFSASTIDDAWWNQNPGSGGLRLDAGLLNFGAGSWIDSKDKVTVDGSKITLESRFAGPKASGRDSHIELVDTESGDVIQVGDTNYWGWGFYIQGTGRYNLIGANLSRGAPTSGINMETNGITTSAFKYYKITVAGDSIIAERGDAEGVYSERMQRQLGTSISGRTFYVRLGTGANDGIYSPAVFDSVKVTTAQ